MIKASRPVPAGLFSTLEDRLCELASSSWFLSDLFSIEEQPLAFNEVRDRDWKEAYKEHFHPWSLGSIHWVPEWERGHYVVPEGHKILFLDPGMAFGTGLHETTRLCLGAIMRFAEKCEVEDRCCIDAGCGSGILALSAKLLGFGEARGFDVDPDAVRISIENAHANKLAGITNFRVDDLDGGLPAESADLLLANVQADILCTNVLSLLYAVRPYGMLALSGILTSEANETAEVFRRRASKAGLQISLQRKDEGDWALLTLERE